MSSSPKDDSWPDKLRTAQRGAQATLTSNRLVGMDVIEAQEGTSTANVKAYWGLAPRWCYGSILVRQPSRGSGAFLDEAMRAAS